MDYNIVSAVDGKTVIGTCEYDEARHRVTNIRMNPGSDKLEIMDLTDVNCYDNEEVFRRGDCLCLRYEIGFGSGRHAVIYDIELSRLDTPEKLHQWVIHLLEKNWITREMLARMVRVCEIHFGYNAHRFIEAA